MNLLKLFENDILSALKIRKTITIWKDSQDQKI